MNTYGTDRFDSWESDNDSDDQLDDNEFGSGLFGVVDDDGDGTISQDELSSNSDLFRDNVQFDELDADGNGNISTDEFTDQI